MINKQSKNETRSIRHARVRKKISGTPERPRLSVYKSLTGIYAQIIDDVNGKTLAAASTLDKEVKTKASNIEAAKAGIKTIVFDRGGYQYHGKVKALAEAAREGGLEF